MGNAMRRPDLARREPRRRVLQESSIAMVAAATSGGIWQMDTKIARHRF
jgi:hypothetical protein